MPYNLFVSHKHADSEIARVLADFIVTKSLKKVTAHVSSNPAYKGPRFGRNLNQELGLALKQAQTLLLIYTSADEDWSYCMWECGVATDPSSPRTNIIVFQCGHDAPKVYQDQLRVDARNLNDIRRFTKMFFTDVGFFSGATEALAPDFSDDDCNQAANELHQALLAPNVLPPLNELAPEDVAAWPLLRLEVNISSIDRLVSPGVGNPTAFEKLLLEEAVIVYADNRAPLLFGVNSLPINMPFGNLVASLPATSGTTTPAWLSSCIFQLQSVAERRLRDVRWASFKQANGDYFYTPIVTRMLRLPSAGKVQFDLHFFDLSNPRSVTVTTRMIPLANIYYKRLDNITRDVKLAALRREMSDLNRERLPLLDDQNRPLFMVHRSILERYLLDQQLAGTDLNQLTVKDLLDQGRGDAFAAAFTTVCATASLADAQQAMADRVRDVFVTENGTRDSPVLGWLTNVDLTQVL